MSGTSSGDDSELEPEVPTEVPSDVEVSPLVGMGCRDLRVRRSPRLPPLWLPPLRSSSFLTLLRPSRRPSLESNAWCSIRPTVLLDQGFGVLELASLDLDEVPAMARQLAEELAIPSYNWLEDALYCWLQEAQQEAKIHRRVRGYLQDDLTWMTLMPRMVLPTKEGAGRGLRYAPEAPPPKRNRKLVDDGCIVAAREERLLDIWCRKLQAELLEMEAPIIGTLKGSLDPDRAALLLVGKTRASTLKRYLSYYRQWRLWLAEAKLRYPPGRPADLVDYLLARRDEPCGRSVPEAILKAISWMERVAEYSEEQRATHGRLAWAAKDKITEILSDGARLIKRAPRYPVHLLAQFEKLVLDPGHAIGWRVWAWAKLLKVWGSLRWSDLQAIIPAELALVEGLLVTTLRRTKTSGPNRRVRELPVAISEHEGVPCYDTKGCYTGPLPSARGLGAMFQKQAKGAFSTSGSEQWPAKLCQWLSAMLVSTCLPAANAAVGEGDHASPVETLPPSSETFPLNHPEGSRVLGGTGPPRFCRQVGGGNLSTMGVGYARLAGGPTMAGAMPMGPSGNG